MASAHTSSTWSTGYAVLRAAAPFTGNGVQETAARFEGGAVIAAWSDAKDHGKPVKIGFGKTGPLLPHLHATTDNVIAVDADKATQVSYLLVLRQARVTWSRAGSWSSPVAGRTSSSGRMPAGCSSVET